MLSDAVIATQANDGLKSCITSCAKSATEASNPALRSTLAQISQDGIRRQGELAKLMQQKGWYTAPALNPAHIQEIMPQLQALIQGSPGSAQNFGTQHQQRQPQQSPTPQQFGEQSFFGSPFTGGYTQQHQQQQQQQHQDQHQQFYT